MDYLASPRIAWTWRTNGNVQGSAALTGKAALVAGRGKRLAALSRTDGTELWSVDLARGTSATPLIADGLAIVGDESGALRAFDLDSGAEQWRVDFGMPIAGTAAHAGPLALIGVGSARPEASDGMLAAVDIATGAVAWQRSAIGGCRSRPAVADDTAVFATRGGKALALSLADGSQRWQADVQPTDADVTIVEGLAIAMSSSGTLWAHDLESGEGAWFFETGRPAWSGGTAMADGLVIAGAADGRLYGVEATTGKVVWTLERRGAREWATWSPPEVAGPVAMATADDGATGTLIGVEAATGRELWSLSLMAWNLARPAAEGGSVIITSSNNGPGATQINFG